MANPEQFLEVLNKEDALERLTEEQREEVQKKADQVIMKLEQNHTQQ